MMTCTARTASGRLVKVARQGGWSSESLKIIPLIAGLVLVSAGCTSSDGPPVFTGGSRADGGTPAADADAPNPTGPDAMPSADAAVAPEGPVVEVISPSKPSTGDFSSAAIVTTARFKARCRVLPNRTTMSPVDTTSVTLSATIGTQTYESPAQPTALAGEFEANLVVSNFDNGELIIRCAATDVSADKFQNYNDLATFLDLGPKITMILPEANANYSVQTELRFSVEAAPVSPEDTLAEPDFTNMSVTLSGVQVTGANLSVVNNAGTFSGNIFFDDPAFAPSLNGPQTLTISAPNARGGATRVLDSGFNVDSKGPTITPISPLAGKLVANVITISATVTDASGIMPLSVVATVASTNEVTLLPNAEGKYTGVFDTRVLASSMIYPNIIIRAQDTAGNQSAHGYVVALDNVAPTISLDSPPMRESQVANGNNECSLEFDPLGRDAVSDGDTVGQLFTLRTRVEDAGNSASTNFYIPVAKVNPLSVQLFILDDESGALIVDTTGDGFCDDINPLLIPSAVPISSNQMVTFEMAAVASGGNSSFPSSAPFGNYQGCSTPTPPSPPILADPMCNFTALTRSINKGGDDAIYAVSPVSIGSQCAGNAIDAVATNLREGWACMAVRAEDNLGNLNVSPVLRACIDTNGNGDLGCGGTTPPQNLANCTGTYNPVTDAVDTTVGCIIAPNFVFPNFEVRPI